VSPHLKRGPAIINCASSINRYAGLPQLHEYVIPENSADEDSYRATKCAIIAFTRSIARELTLKGIISLLHRKYRLGDVMLGSRIYINIYIETIHSHSVSEPSILLLSQQVTKCMRKENQRNISISAINSPKTTDRIDT